ncbi:MAG: DUF1640 domain-containing protein [Nitrospirae bacterium]|nr:DUF1640 domain-containing protein [Nitrospirota bacterium]
MTIPRVLREKLGEDGVDALLTVFSEVSLNTRNDLATKSDIRDMATKSDIRDMATKSDLKEMATALRQEMATKEDIANLKTEIEKSKTDTIKWMLAFAATQVGILIAAMGLMFKFFIR